MTCSGRAPRKRESRTVGEDGFSPLEGVSEGMHPFIHLRQETGSNADRTCYNGLPRGSEKRVGNPFQLWALKPKHEADH